MQVLVAGGTGFIGRHLCRVLADRGHGVTALSRSRDADVPDGVTLATGDVTDYGSIAGHVDEHDVVVNLVALSPLFEPRGGNEMHDRIHLGGTQNLVDAAANGRVDRFVQMSALGADPNGPTAYVRAKGRAEAAVREADVEHVIVRPSVVFGDGGEFLAFTKKLTPPVLAPLPGGGRTRFQPIWVGDLAPMLADAATAPDHAGRTYELGGPAVLTLREVAKLVRPGVTVVPVPMALAGVGLGLAGAIPGVRMGGDQFRSLKFDNTTDDNDVTAFGRTPDSLRTLADYLQEKQGS
ncbi:MAG: complex I NDUFA9 subunit family protein [Halobacteriaceae archaeon]